MSAITESTKKEESTMKQYDHEPSMVELFDQLREEYAYKPDFIPDIKVPIIGKKITKGIIAGMVETTIEGMFT